MGVKQNDTYNVLKWLTFFVFLVFVRPFSTPRVVKGLERLQDLRLQGPLIISANHAGRIDPVWIYYIVQVYSKSKPNIRFLAWYRFYDMPVIGWYIRKMQSFRIESKKGLGVLDEVVEYISHGGVAMIFPEGYIKKETEKQRRAKRGVGYLVVKTNAPVLPVFISYQRKSFWPGYWAEIKFGPIQTELGANKTEDDIQDVADKVLSFSYTI